MMKRLLLLSLISLMLPLSSPLESSVVLAEEAKAVQKTRKTPAMREKVYSQLARAQALADEGQIAEGLEVLDRVKGRLKQLNSYERAMLFNFYGFIHYGQENLPAAIEAFNQVVAEQNIPESLELSTLYSLAQLYMQNNQYAKTIEYIDRWETLNRSSNTSNAMILKASAFYATKDFNGADRLLTNVIGGLEKAGEIPAENLLSLHRAVLYELKLPKRVTEISEKLVRYYNKPNYWVELANMYGEIGEERKQLAIFEAAYQQGYVTKGSDYKSLAQLYFFNGAPFESARVMQEGLDKNILEANEQNLRFLAQSLTTAKEYTRALPYLEQLAEVSSNGAGYARLAETLSHLNRWSDVLVAAQKALELGGLDNTGNMHVAIGMAHFNLKNYSKAGDAFRVASEYPKVKAMSSQWLKYVTTEQAKADEYQRLLAEG